MKRILLAAIAAVLMTGAAHAGSKPTLPKEFRGEWCVDSKTQDYRRARSRQSDGWLNVTPNGFTGHELNCKLRFAEAYLHGTNAYRTTFKCTGDDDAPWIVHYWIGTNNGHWTTGSNNGRLYMNEETDAETIKRWFTE